MYEDGNMQDRVGEKVMQLNSIIINKTGEEIGARKGKSVLEIRSNIDNFIRIFIRTAMA